MRISDIFHVIQGHQITDEEIYVSLGHYPIYTGNNEIKGYWNHTIVTKEMLPCLTYPTKAFAGVISLQNELFDANNTAVLYLKDKYKDKFVLEWFRFILPSLFFDKMTSKEGVSYLNKEIVKNIEINIPDKSIQEKQVIVLKKMEKIEKIIKQNLLEVEKNLDKNVVIEEEIQEENVLLNSIMSYVSRNDVLSEEGIYKMYPRDNKTAEVLSGSTSNIKYGKIDGNFDNVHYLEGRQCLHIVTRGKAGKLTFVEKGNYATNTNAFLLYIRHSKWNELNIHNEYEEEIYLKYLKIYLQPIFYCVSSNSDVSVFPLTEIMKKLYIPKFTFNKEFIKCVNAYEKLEKKANYLRKILNDIENIKKRKLVY